MRLHICWMLVLGLMGSLGHAACRLDDDRSKEVGNGATTGHARRIQILRPTAGHIIGNGAFSDLSESDLVRVQRIVDQLEAAAGGDRVTEVSFDADDSEPVLQFTQRSGVTEIPVSCL